MEDAGARPGHDPIQFANQVARIIEEMPLSQQGVFFEVMNVHRAQKNGPYAGHPITGQGQVAESLDTSTKAFGAYGGEEISLSNIEEAMRYQPWDRKQLDGGEEIREILTLAAKAILKNAPRSARRTLALQHVISARMDANAAISFRGRF